MDGAAQRSTQVPTVPASDQGSGVGRVTLEVNGRRTAAPTPAVHWRPTAGSAGWPTAVPGVADDEFQVDTTATGSAEGQNSIEVCVTDYAQGETDDSTSLAGEA